MTMKREAKAKATTEYVARYTGEIETLGLSPRQYEIYGRILPGPVAAKIYLSYRRVTKGITREIWTEERTGRRRKVRVF